MQKRVLLGMSSGIDSSVSAMLLQEQGYDVVGITFLFGDLPQVNDTISRDAKSLADKLGIKHLTIDLQKEFKNSVIKYFKNEYLEGRTPFPCAYCNPRIKFHYLNEFAKSENCEFIATGHYVKTDNYKGQKYIFQGADPEKDQSFFLWGLPRDLINKIHFTLGEF
jgi:tRNA-specific 2-thiouridylase